ncbi:MAG: branched-chain amino acid ABC transporter permease [Candidatus Bathyarchaeia archaeon]
MAFLAALLILPIFESDPFLLHILIMSMFWAAAGGGWNIVGGYSGQLSLGHAVFFGLGAYACALLLILWAIPPIIGALFGALISILAALFITFPTSRLRGPYFALATLAFGESIRIIFLLLKDVTGGAIGLGVPAIGEIPFIGERSMGYALKGDPIVYLYFVSKAPYYYFTLALMLIVLCISHKVENSKFGIFLEAIRENEDAAMSLGVPTLKYKLYASIVSAAITSICGSFYAVYIRYVTPYTVFNLMFSVQMAIVTILGGMGTVWGPVIGSFILTPASEALRVFLSGRLAAGHLVVYGAIMIAIIMLLPKGITPSLRLRFRRSPRLTPRDGDGVA